MAERALTPSTTFNAGSNKSLYGHAIVLTTGVGVITNGDTTAAISAPASGSVSMQVTGTFGAAGSVALEGSNDGVNFVALFADGTSSTVIAVTAAGIASTKQICAFYRGRATAGDGTTALTVTFCITSPL